MMAYEPNSGNYDSVTPKTNVDMIKEVEKKESTAKQEAMKTRNSRRDESGASPDHQQVRTNGSGGGERCRTRKDRLLEYDSEGGKVAGSVAGKKSTEKHERISKSSFP
jgi:hypothetical protein